MPKMTGLELLKEVRANDKFKDTPFLMVTAEAQKENIVEAVKGQGQQLYRQAIHGCDPRREAG